MNTIVVSVLLLGGVIVCALVRERASDRRQVIVSRLLLAVATLGVSGAAMWGALPGGPLFAGVWLLSGLVSSAQPLKQARLTEQLGGLMVSVGPLLASMTLTQMAIGEDAAEVFDPLQAGLLLVCGALLALSLGFWTRAAERLSAVSVSSAGQSVGVSQFSFHSALPLAAGFGALFVFRRLASLGPSYNNAYLPVVGEDGQAIRWVTEVGSGLAVAAKVESLHVLLLTAAAVSVLSAVLPKIFRAADLSVVAGAMMLAGAVWMITMDGEPVDVVALTEEARVMIDRFSTLPGNGAPAQVVGQGAGKISVLAAAVPLLTLISSGLTAVGAGLAQLTRRDATQEAFEGDANRLAARDAGMFGTLCVWLALGAWLFQVRHTTGVWGPVGPADHLISGVAFGVTASLMVLYGVGGRDHVMARALRVAAIGLALALVLGLIVGGMASSVGLFEL